MFIVLSLSHSESVSPVHDYAPCKVREVSTFWPVFAGIGNSVHCENLVDGLL